MEKVTFEQLPEVVATILHEVRELKRLHSNDQPETNSQPEYLTRKQTAERLHLSLTTLDSYTKLGILTAHKIGHRVLYRAAEINDSLSEKIRDIKNKMK